MNKETKEKYSFDNCIYINTLITCSEASKRIKGGIYVLNSINGNERFDISEITTELFVDHLAKQLITEQLYKESDITFFSIVLDSNDITTP